LPQIQIVSHLFRFLLHCHHGTSFAEQKGQRESVEEGNCIPPLHFFTTKPQHNYKLPYLEQLDKSKDINRMHKVNFAQGKFFT